MAFDANGNFYALAGSTLYEAAYTSATERFGTPVAILPTTSPGYGTMTSDAAGDLFVSTVQANGNSNFYYVPAGSDLTKTLDTTYTLIGTVGSTVYSAIAYQNSSQSLTLAVLSKDQVSEFTYNSVSAAWSFVAAPATSNGNSTFAPPSTWAVNYGSTVSAYSGNVQNLNSLIFVSQNPSNSANSAVWFPSSSNSDRILTTSSDTYGASAIDLAGNLYVIDLTAHSVLLWTSTQLATAIAGSSSLTSPIVLTSTEGVGSTAQALATNSTNLGISSAAASTNAYFAGGTYITQFAYNLNPTFKGTNYYPAQINFGAVASGSSQTGYAIILPGSDRITPQPYIYVTPSPFSIPTTGLSANECTSSSTTQCDITVKVTADGGSDLNSIISNSIIVQWTYQGNQGTSFFVDPFAYDYAVQTYSAANSTITAPGTGTAGTGVTVTATVNDTTGAPFAGQTVTLTPSSTSGNAAISSISNGGVSNSSGVVTATLNDTTAESATVSASVGGVAFSTTASTAFAAGPVSSGQSTVVATSTSVTSGNTTTVTVTLKDAYSNIIPNASVQLLHGNSSTVTPGNGTTTNSSGQATFTVGDLTAEQDTFTAISGNTVISQEANITFNPGPAVAAKSSVNVSPSSQTVGSNATITAMLVDTNGNPLTNTPVTVSATNGTTNSPQSTNASGVATITVSDTAVETDTYTVSGGGLTFSTQPTVGYTVGPLSTGVSTVTINSSSASVTQMANVTVTVKDQYGNPISGATVTVSSNNSGSITLNTGSPTGSNGQAIFSINDSVAETDTVTAKVNGIALSTTPQITFTPGPPSAAQSSVIATSSSINAQANTTITVTLKDQNGNVIPSSSVYLSATESNGCAASLGGTQSTNNSGVATFTVSDNCYETDTFTAHAGSVAITQTAQVVFNALSQTITFGSFSPSSVAITPGGTVSVPTATASSSLSVTFSTNSTACSVSGSTVSLLHVGSCVITAAQNGNSTYSAATSKTATLNITIGSNVISGYNSFPNASYNYGGSAPSLTGVSASSNLPVSFSSAYTSNCTVSGTTIALVGIGTCSITAQQAGNSDYVAATAVTQTFQVIQGINTVSFMTQPTNVTYQQGETLSATAVSGLTPVIFSVSGGGCSVSGNSLTATAAGTNNCIITATQAGNTLWAQGSASATISILQAQSQGAFLFLGGVTYSPNGTASAASYLTTNNPGGSTSYSGGATNICSVASNGTISILGGGSCPVNVTIGATQNYSAGSANGNLTINPASQTLSFGSFSPSSVAFGGTAPSLPTATAQTTITYGSTNTSVCTINSNGSGLTIKSVGTCGITATAASTANYQTASSTSSFSITGGANTITFPSLGSTTFSPGATTTASASSTAGTSVVAIVYTSNTPAVCSVNGSTITALTGGTCTIAASQAAGGNYLAASNNGVTSTWTINPATQTVNFPAFSTASILFGTAAPSLPTATAPTLGGAITYASLNINVCTLSSNQAPAIITVVATGTCTIQATAAATASYQIGTANQGFSITAGTDTITISPLSPVTYSPNATLTVSATSTAGTSVQPILFSTNTPSVCSVSGTTVTIKTGGTCTVLADQAAGGNYAQATEASANLTINQATQSLSFPSFQNVPITYGASAPSIPTATALGGATITYSSLTTSVCTVNGSAVTVVTAGTCTVQASAASTASYLSATATQGFTINQASQTINFTVPSNTNYSPSPTTIPLSATATSGLQVSFSVSPSTVCTLNGASTAILMQGLGTCNVTASQAGNIDYNPATSINGSFQVLLGTNTITFNAFSPNSVALSGTPPTLASSSTATATAGTAYATSGLAVTFSSLYPSICSVSGTTITSIKTGTCTILAAQTGNALYGNAAGVTQSFVITLGSQTITFPNPGNQTYTSSLIPLSATTSANAASGLTVSYTSNNTNVCTISASGTAAQLIGLGNCSITASQAGDGINYAAATPVTVQFSVSAAANAVTILPPGGTTFGSTVTSYVQANSTAGVTSQNPIVFGSATPLICSVSTTGVTLAGNTYLGVGQITVISAGNCGITAYQAAAGNFAAAPTVQANFVISQATQTLTFAPFASSQISYGSAAPALPAATALGGATITFSSLTPSVCSLTSNTSSAVINVSASGMCTIQASAAATTNYQSATATQSFSISTSNNIINISPLTAVTFGSVGTVQASATSTAGVSTTAIVFGSTASDSGVCSVSSSGLITISGGGTCTITANQNATNGYNQAQQATTTLTINPATQTVTFPAFSTTSILFGTAAPSLPTATAPSLGGAITYASLNTNVCTLSSNQAPAFITVVATGTCTIQATAAATASYQLGTANQGFTITTGSNVISFPSLGSVLFSPGATATAAATSSASPTGTGISYGVTSADSGICTINGSTITVVSGGSCVVTANQGATGYYGAASQVTSTLTINPGPQTVTFGSFVPQSIVYGSTVPTLPAASAPGGPLTFISLTTSVCTINSNGTGLSVLTVGTCTIQATSSATVSYQLATATSGFTITGSTNTITFPSLGSITYGSAAPTATATSTASPSGSGIVFAATSADAGICSVSSGGSITVLGGGSCVVTANQGATGNYAAASQVTSTLTINPATQTVTFGSFSPSSILFGTTPPSLPAASAPGGTITYSSLTSSVCTISATTITVLTTGTCTIQATSAANASYLSASASSSFTIANGNNVITFAPFNPSSVSFTATPPALTAIASSGLAVVYSSTTASTCSVSGSTITFVASGVCSITASQPGNLTYVAATPVSQSFTITPVPFGFTVAAASQTVVAGNTATYSFSLTPTNGVYPGPVTFSISGLPAGVTATFSPSTIASNAGAQTVTLSIVTPVTLVKNGSQDKTPWVLALLLPLFLLRRSRRKLGKLLLLAVFVSTGIFALSGCSHPSSATSSITAQNYNFAVTATSGTGTVTTTITMIVQ